MTTSNSASTSVEEILAKVLEPDNEAIKTGTAELREALKRPTIAQTLLHIGKYSASVQIRQYAMVLLRKRLAKYYHWEKLTVDFKHGIKTGLLDALTREAEQTVRNSVTQAIAAIAKHELADGKWPELLNLIQQLSSQGAQAGERELGLYALSVVADVAGEELKPYLKPFITVFHAALQDPSTGPAFYAGMTLKNLVPYIGSEEATMVQPLIPKVAAVMKKLVATDGDRAVQLMEIWEELLETEVSMLAPHLKDIADLCLQVAAKKELDDALRVKALHFLSTLARLKKKSMIKNKLVAPILQTLFALMAEEEEEDEDDDEEDDDDEVESSKPHVVAAQTLNEMALHLPPERVVSPLLQWAEPAIKGSDVHSMQAAFTALAVVAEGCAEHIRTKYLEALVRVICGGIRHPVSHVRNAALYAVGQFSEHLQPDFAKYTEDVLPPLFEYLSATCQTLASGQKVPKSVDRVFYALEMFCETMESKLIPYVPSLMEHFFAALNPAYPFHVKELALSAIGATANAVEKAMVPYFGRIMEHLKIYLSGQLTQEEMPLQIQALDTLGVIARTIGVETFQPFAQECVQFTLNLIQNKDDPDLRKCAYGVFASVATVLKDDMGPALPTIVPLLLEAVQSTEGVTVQLKGDGDEAEFPAGDLLDDEEEDVSPMDNEDDEEEDVAGYTVENAYLEEKEEACLALRELALHARGAFLPYVEQSSGPVYKLVDYGHEDVRKASFAALTQFCICLGKQPDGEVHCQPALAVLMPKLSEAVNTDTEMVVVNEALDCLTELLKELKGVVLKAEGHLDAILLCIRNVFNKATQCQMMEQAEEGQGEDDDYDPEDPDCEAGEKLIEYAGDVLPALGLAMTPQEFAPYFAGLLPSIMLRAKKNSTIAEKSFSGGLLAVCMEPLDGVLEPFAGHLYTTYTNLMKDEDPEVRNNAIFGLGELVLHGRELVFQHYPQILQMLSVALSREDNPLALDNICAAISRLIVVNIGAVPMDQVFPVLMKNLPLREDMHENSSILRCFMFLFTAGHPQFQVHLSQILAVVAHMATQEELLPEQKPMINELMANISTGFPEAYQSWASSLPAEVQLKMKEVLS